MRDSPKDAFSHRRERGPKIIVIGGGHGQATILRGLKNYTTNLTAIVTVADDGGSSGRLRRDLGVLPPGDFRNCIAALADDEALVTRLFQYRFAGGQDLKGHSFGNLFISAMADVTGSFESALKESSRVLAVQGQVLPSTLETITLCADVKREGDIPIRVHGESNIPKMHGQILRVMLEPDQPKAYPEAVHAILDAELIVIGPGSLYTSILPNLLVPEILQALQMATAKKVYICNVATQHGETDGYMAKEHLYALEKHLGRDVIDTVVVNNHIPDIDLPQDVSWVQPDIQNTDKLRVIAKNLIDANLGWRHESKALAQTLMGLLKFKD